VEPLAPDDPHEIGPYLLQGRLGTGGMGSVYLGRAADGTSAAVKVVHSRFAADPTFRQRFAREITVARAVNGRWVVTTRPDRRAGYPLGLPGAVPRSGPHRSKASDHVASTWRSAATPCMCCP
jgi:eukaryotic-like serine/threonine-protein kinase